MARRPPVSTLYRFKIVDAAEWRYHSITVLAQVSPPPNTTINT